MVFNNTIKKNICDNKELVKVYKEYPSLKDE